MNENRILNHTEMEKIGYEIADKRKELLMLIENSVEEIIKFSIPISNALGDISIYEAKQGIIDKFTELINKAKI